MSDLEVEKASLAEVIKAFNNLSTEDSQELRQLCEQLVQLSGLVDKATEVLKNIKAIQRKYATELVPDAMDEMGMQSITTANGVDVSNWFGCKKHFFYNFKPEVRPVPINIHF